MALYTTSSPSVNSTTVINDSLATTNHHLQTDKRQLMENDNAVPAKRKRLSMTITESNINMNTLLPPTSSCTSLVNTCANDSTVEHTLPPTKPHITIRPLPLENEVTPLSTNQHNTSQYQDITLVAPTEVAQQTPAQLDDTFAHQQENVGAIPSPLSTTLSSQLPPILPKQEQHDTLEVVEVIGTREQVSTQEQETKASLSPPLSSVSDQPPLTCQQQQQQQRQDTTELPEQIKPEYMTSPSTSSQQQTTATSPLSSTQSPPSPPPVTTEGRSKRKRKPVEYNTDEWETIKVKTKPRKSKKKTSRGNPRWYNQSYMIFLALREHPDHCLSRPDLINAALAMDEKISKERNLPKVFRSKTPMNSASAVLTTNSDRYYIPYRPEGSRCMWFRLAYTPGNFAHAYGEYRKWMDKLIEHDWLYCFGVPLENSTPMTVDEIAAITPFSSTTMDPNQGTAATTTETTTTSLDSNDKENSNSAAITTITIDSNQLTTTTTSIESNTSAPGNSNNKENSNSAAIATTTIDSNQPTATTTSIESTTPAPVNSNDKENSNSAAITTTTIDSNQPTTETSTTTPAPLNNNDKENDNSAATTPASLNSNNDKENSNGTESTTTTTTDLTELNKVQQTHPPQPMYRLDQLDLSNVPTKWQDIVQVATSTIPNAGQGLFAVRELPYNTPLGFYFGVPMTEYEFDSIKENVGRASEYSIMYRRTILDATDEHGEPYTINNDDDNNERLCPFHYMNEAKDIHMANILFVEGVVVNQVICWSKRNIMPGEELLVWYGKEVNRYWKDDASTDQQQGSSS